MSDVVNHTDALSTILSHRRYIALGIEPIVPVTGVIFVPDAFSPVAIDIENRTYRVRGEKVKTEGFSLRIYDPYNRVVFESDDTRGANLGRTARSCRPCVVLPILMSDL